MSAGDTQYVLAKEGIGKVCNVPEGMGKVFSGRISIVAVSLPKEITCTHST